MSRCCWWTGLLPFGRVGRCGVWRVGRGGRGGGGGGGGGAELCVHAIERACGPNAPAMAPGDAPSETVGTKPRHAARPFARACGGVNPSCPLRLGSLCGDETLLFTWAMRSVWALASGTPDAAAACARSATRGTAAHPAPASSGPTATRSATTISGNSGTVAHSATTTLGSAAVGTAARSATQPFQEHHVLGLQRVVEPPQMQHHHCHCLPQRRALVIGRGLKRMFNNNFIVLPCLHHFRNKGKCSGMGHAKTDLEHATGGRSA